MRVTGVQASPSVRISHRSHPPLGAARSPFGSVAIIVALAALVAVAGCGSGAAAAATPTPVPTPTPTPNPHLAAPASVDAVFTWLTGHGLTIIPNNADAGGKGEPIKRINATYAGWPLILSQYSSEAAARSATGIGKKASKPTADEAPFSFLGLNIVVDFGPRLRRDDDPAPDARFVTAANALALALDPILGPLSVRAAAPVVLPTPTPTVAPSPTPTVAPSKAPAPTATPKPKKHKHKPSPTPSA